MIPPIDQRQIAEALRNPQAMQLAQNWPSPSAELMPKPRRRPPPQQGQQNGKQPMNINVQQPQPPISLTPPKLPGMP